MAGPLIPIIGAIGRGAFSLIRPFFATPARAALTTATTIAADGASGTDVTKPIRQIMPAPVESTLNGIHNTGKMASDFASSAAPVIGKVTELASGLDKGLLGGIGGLLGTGMLMNEGAMKDMMLFGFALMLLDGVIRMATGKGMSEWVTGKSLASHFNEFTGADKTPAAPTPEQTQRQGVAAPALTPGGM